jgi:S1-C subfamily serine protease
MGFSGGPVVDRSGRLVGLTTALTAPGTAPVMAALTGVDVEGFWDGARREVFILAAPVIEAELRRIAPGARLAMSSERH